MPTNKQIDKWLARQYFTFAAARMLGKIDIAQSRRGIAQADILAEKIKRVRRLAQNRKP